MYRIHLYLKKTILAWIDFFHIPFKRYIPLQTFRYAACGGANTLFDVCLFTLSHNFIFKKDDVDLGLVTLSSPVAALFLALSISLPSGFYLNRYVVFQDTGLRKRNQFIRYCTMTGVCIILNYIFLKIFMEYLGLYPTPAKIISTFIIIGFSYTAQTYLLFKSDKKALII